MLNFRKGKNGTRWFMSVSSLGRSAKMTKLRWRYWMFRKHASGIALPFIARDNQLQVKTWRLKITHAHPQRVTNAQIAVLASMQPHSQLACHLVTARSNLIPAFCWQRNANLFSSLQQIYSRKFCLAPLFLKAVKEQTTADKLHREI